MRGPSLRSPFSLCHPDESKQQVLDSQLHVALSAAGGVRTEVQPVPSTCIHSQFRRGVYAGEGASGDFQTGVTPAGAQGEPGGTRLLLACAAGPRPLNYLLNLCV